MNLLPSVVEDNESIDLNKAIDSLIDSTLFRESLNSADDLSQAGLNADDFESSSSAIDLS